MFGFFWFWASAGPAISAAAKSAADAVTPWILSVFNMRS
jgi:hypothetical protein